MQKGKMICEQLRALRRCIAEENGIPLEQRSCTHDGDCSGTCPYCEAEMSYLERSLAHRIRLGQVATVAGLTLGLALGGSAIAQEVVPSTPPQPSLTLPEVLRGTLKGSIVDIEKKEPIIIAQGALFREGKEVASFLSDLDGLFTVKNVPFGTYQLKIQAFGFKSVDTTLTISHEGFTVIVISLPPMNSDKSATIMGPAIEIGAESQDNTRSSSDFPMLGEIQVVLPGTPASQSEPSEPPTLYEEEPTDPSRLIITR